MKPDHKGGARMVPALILVVAVALWLDVSVWIDLGTERRLGRVADEIVLADSLLTQQDRQLVAFVDGRSTEAVTREVIFRARGGADKALAAALAQGMAEQDYDEIKLSQISYRIAADGVLADRSAISLKSADGQLIELAENLDQAQASVLGAERDAERHLGLRAVLALLASLAALALMGGAWWRRRHTVAAMRLEASFAAQVDDVTRHGSTLHALVNQDLTLAWHYGGSHLALPERGTATANLIQLVHPEDSIDLVAWMARPLTDDGVSQSPPVVARLLGADGSWIHHDVILAEARTIAGSRGFTLNAVDCSSRIAGRVDREAALRADGISGLRNRLALAELLVRTREEVRSGSSAWLAVIAMTNLREINTIHGTTVGDDVIASVARTLESALLPDTDVFRIGSGEFAILGREDDNRSSHQVMNLLSEVSAPMSTRSGPVRGQWSAGMAYADCYCPDEADALLEHASEALGEAGRSGRATVVVHDESVTKASAERRERHSRMMRLAEVEFPPVVVVPLIDLATRNVATLVDIDWGGPTSGTDGTRALMRTAEDAGLANSFMLRVLSNESIKELRLDQGLLGIRIVASALQPRHLLALMEATSRAGLRPSDLMVLMDEDGLCLAESEGWLEATRNLGFQVGVEDFGSSSGPTTPLRRGLVDWVEIASDPGGDLESTRRQLIELVEGCGARIIRIGSDCALGI